jgi:hypothetical protein
MEIRDSYEQFFEIFPKDKFFDFGLKNIITIDKKIVSIKWKELMKKISEHDTDLYIRDFGRSGNENDNVKKLYKDIFNININFDPTNNAKPSQLLQSLTDYRTNKTIFNYQISHVFGNTKNVYCFTAPWNIIFIPKIIDPFTGHEAKGKYVEEFQLLFRKNIVVKFKDEITEYNNIMERIIPRIKLWVENNIIEKKRESYIKEFKKISIV